MCIYGGCFGKNVRSNLPHERIDRTKIILYTKSLYNIFFLRRNPTKIFFRKLKV